MATKTLPRLAPSITFKSRPALEKALKTAGIEPVQIHGRGTSLEVELKDGKDARKFQKQVAGWGGFKTGYNGWILRPNYQSPGNPSDPASSWHY